MKAAKLVRISILLLLSLTACGSADQTVADGSEAVIATAQAKAELTREATRQTPPPTPVTPSPTVPLITDTPFPSLTPTPSVPIVIADYNAYVRTGPDESFESIDFFLQGQTAEVIGRYENETTGTWWSVRRIEAGRDGWVWSGAVTFAGDENVVPFIDPPPFPAE
ncbi:MAG: SH3 domain-containing protein [Anaerolineales bacterium]|nr:SH3 domain-containing protein [Anaerolineales bacterium]